MISATQRLSRELPKLHKDLPPGIALAQADGFDEWFMDISVPDANPLYVNQTFRLKFKFSEEYPIKVPEVTFQRLSSPPRPIPLHPHVYSNGIICLDLLGQDQGWAPVHNVLSVCMSIQSMLAGNTKAERPPGDDQFVRSNTRRPRDVAFVYDDETV